MSENKNLPELFRIEEIEKEKNEKYLFTIKYDGKVKMGQFFLISIPNYKEEVVFVSDIKNSSIKFEITRPSRVKEEIFDEAKGRYFYIRGPYGNGFDVKEDKDTIIIMDQKGKSSINILAKYYAQKEQNILIIYQADEKDENIEKLAKENVKIMYFENINKEDIQNLEIKDSKNTFCYISTKDKIFKEIAQTIAKKGIQEENIFVLKNQNIVCGVGKCGHCRSSNIYACLDGPVFKYSKIKDLVD